MELNYQKRFQEMQQSTRRNQREEISKKHWKGSPENFNTSRVTDLLEMWQSWPQEECTAILFCTNCGRNNHITSKCRQTFKENCCKRNNHTKEYCTAKRLDSFKQNQMREFQVHYGE